MQYIKIINTQFCFYCTNSLGTSQKIFYENIIYEKIIFNHKLLYQKILEKKS